MAQVTINGIDEAKAMVGKTVGPSEWSTVTQADIDDFARLSGDDQWIHVDVERAERESPFGTTIAHGNLTLSMIDGMRRELVTTSGFKLGVNYGWNKVRFPAPVPAGSRLTLYMNDFLTKVELEEQLAPGTLKGKSFSTRLTVTEGPPIVAEEALYWLRDTAPNGYWRAGAASFGIPQ